MRRQNINQTSQCFCGVTELLKFGIECLARQYKIILIDCEAGIEQINRRVISRLDT
jgi:CO dehydrogenase maturation factor